MARTKRCTKIRDELIAFALTLPEAWEDHPWDETAAKVRKKIFVFFGGREGSCLGLTMKLPESGAFVLTADHAEPAGYGLGRSGWVTLEFTDAADVDPEHLRELIVESYCAVAPKTLAAQVEAGLPAD